MSLGGMGGWVTHHQVRITNGLVDTVSLDGAVLEEGNGKRRATTALYNGAYEKSRRSTGNPFTNSSCLLTTQPSETASCTW